MVSVSIQNPNAWLAKATGDLKAAKKCMQGSPDTLDSAAYHTQQVAEKALKAFLVFHAAGLPKIHDLVRLVMLCQKIDFTFVQLEQYAADLTVYATYTRYPDDWFTISQRSL